MADIADELSQLMSQEYVTHVAVVLAAYFAPALLRNTIDGIVDLPDEVYGIAVAALAFIFLGDDTGRYAALGGGVYTAEKAAERVGIKQTVEQMGA